MERPADAALVDQLLGQGDRRHAAIVEPDHVRHARLLDGGGHLFALGHVHRQRLFAEDHLAGLGGGQHDLAVRVVRRADVDHVDVVAGDQLPPVGLVRLIAPVLGERLDLVLVAGAAGLEHRAVLAREELVHLAVRVRVGPAHEAVADHADVQRGRHGTVLKQMRNSECGIRKVILAKMLKYRSSARRANAPFVQSHTDASRFRRIPHSEFRICPGQRVASPSKLKLSRAISASISASFSRGRAVPSSIPFSLRRPSMDALTVVKG